MRKFCSGGNCEEIHDGRMVEESYECINDDRRGKLGRRKGKGEWERGKRDAKYMMEEWWKRA